MMYRITTSLTTRVVTTLGLALALLLVGVGCKQESSSSPNTPKTKKEMPMSTIQTEIFKWTTSISNYNVDLGNIDIETLIPENWFKDVSGKIVRQFYGTGGMWGVGSPGIGGEERTTALPKTLHMSYYDYIEDRFYVLDAELDQRKIYEHFKLKSLNLDYEGKEHISARFDELVVGIAPQGHIMVWIGQRGGENQVELASYRATQRKDMTVEAYNSKRPKFEIETPRLEHLAATDNGLRPDTIAKIKAGWLPSADYYMRKQRIQYPWRYAMSGNAKLVEYNDRLGNAEQSTVWPYELATKQMVNRLRGAPREAQFFFMDKDKKRHSVYIKFFTQDRVSSEPDLANVWAALEKMFPGRTLEQNMDWPGEADMATVDIHVSDDLKTYTATLIKGDVRIALPIAPRPQVHDLEPYAHFLGEDTPPAHVVKWLKEGPPQ
jgi:Protein of unknown function (DUF2931)